METFTQLKELVDDPGYKERRRESLSKLDLETIDAPIAETVCGLIQLPYCFTLQSCYGHFIYKGQKNPRSTEPLPISSGVTTVEYRIAYIALCIQKNDKGEALFNDLAGIPAIDPAYIQFGCAEWFWKTDPNTYALQVEPERHMNKDSVSLDYQEALHIEKVRNEFFSALKKLIQEKLGNNEYEEVP
ncbi:hypothetical protein ACFLXV_00855 [Chloroflexota bacterium]